MSYFGYQNSEGLKLMKSIDDIINALNKKILILDGALGTMIQNEELKENDFRAERFNNHDVNLFGNNDILNLTKPGLIYDIHKLYLDAGADIIETNTFNSTGISQEDYKCQDLAYELNIKSSRSAEITNKVKELYKKGGVFNIVKSLIKIEQNWLNNTQINTKKGNETYPYNQLDIDSLVNQINQDISE